MLPRDNLPSARISIQPPTWSPAAASECLDSPSAAGILPAWVCPHGSSATAGAVCGASCGHARGPDLGGCKLCATMKGAESEIRMLMQTSRYRSCTSNTRVIPVLLSCLSMLLSPDGCALLRRVWYVTVTVVRADTALGQFNGRGETDAGTSAAGLHQTQPRASHCI